MIYVLPRKAENKKRSFFGRLIKNKNSLFSEENVTVNGKSHTLLYVDGEFSKTEDFYKMLSPFKGNIMFHPSFYGSVFNELSADISGYKKLCIFSSFLNNIKSGSFKNATFVIKDKSGILCSEIPKLMMFVKGVKIITASERYGENFKTGIYKKYGVKVNVCESADDLKNKSFCRVDFDSVTEENELVFMYNNRINRIKPDNIKLNLSDEEKVFFGKLADLGIREEDLCGAHYLTEMIVNI